MKNSTKLLLVLFVFAAAFSGCSKEKKFTKNLTKDGGEWRIVSHTKKEYYTGASEPHKTYVLAENQGSFTFDKSGEVIYSFYFAYTESMMTLSGTWSNTEDEITTIIESQYFKYKVLEQSKKGLTLEAEEVYEHDKSVYTLVLEKI